MHRFFLWWGIIFLFFLNPNLSFAQVVLNEIYANPENEEDEFIELFNNSDTEIDLKDWKVTDLVKSYTITDLKIPAKNFLVLEKILTSIALNNSDEKVSLMDNQENLIDSFSYDITYEGTSWSRVGDGTGGFVNGTPLTKNSQNAPAPTPTFTITPAPTKTPSPTKEPSPTRSPSPTTVQVKEPTLIAGNGFEKSANSPIPSKKILKSASVSRDQEVAGIIDEKPFDKRDEEKSTPSYLYSFTTGLGLLILGCGILLYKKFRQKREEDNDDF